MDEIDKLYEEIRILTKKLQEKLRENLLENEKKKHNIFLLQNTKIISKNKKFIKAAGLRGTTWDNTIIRWKDSLRY